MKLVLNSTDTSAKALDITGSASIKTLVNVADAIKLHADAGAAQTISIVNDEGSTDGTQSAAGVAAVINISATDGGIIFLWNDAKDLGQKVVVPLSLQMISFKCYCFKCF